MIKRVKLSPKLQEVMNRKTAYQVQDEYYFCYYFSSKADAEEFIKDQELI